MYLLRQNVEQTKDLLENNIDMNDKDLNIALGKLFNGIDLKTEKVELNIFSDYIKELDKISSKTRDKSESDLEEVKKIIKRNISNLNKLKSKADNIHKEYMRVGDKAAKDLDIAPAQIPDFKRLHNLYFYVDGIIDDMLSEYKKMG